MHFTTTTLTALLPLLAMGAPTTPRDTISMAADGAQWTIQSMQRVCNAADTSCKWTFGINTNTAGAATTPCAFVVAAAAGVAASRAPETGAQCGGFQVTSGWSGQFGEGNGFTTLSVVDTAKRLIAWPAYSDADLAGGKVVVPDRSFAVQKLP
ncbi:hypothetical protein QBC33DRAFT_442926 [Phialemonium atrogriseum]|uniref:Small secreted protein n=1 Tax=Phialemonium atrogriseum TaxID=1093897 RepID=A0AAJ0CA15_9PEZI|nr:uncharacterized protein QBC33DRAFT_442926 [Phialemonium atrogriseum]KAK1772741.1 hypothetical protein QBC33DRAFT_442926 [Phialemonium atrogriseum]